MLFVQPCFDRAGTNPGVFRQHRPTAQRSADKRRERDCPAASRRRASRRAGSTPAAAATRPERFQRRPQPLLPCGRQAPDATSPSVSTRTPSRSARTAMKKPRSGTSRQAIRRRPAEERILPSLSRSRLKKSPCWSPQRGPFRLLPQHRHAQQPLQAVRFLHGGGRRQGRLFAVFSPSTFEEVRQSKVFADDARRRQRQRENSQAGRAGEGQPFSKVLMRTAPPPAVRRRG